MIGALIGAGIGLFSSIWGGIQASKQAKKADEELKKQRQANKDWYTRRYNEDYTKTAEAQGLLTRAREAANSQIREAIGRQAVMGGTDASIEAARNSANDMVSDTLTNIAELGSKRKDGIENQYLQRENKISKQYQLMYNQRAMNNSTAAGSGMQAGMGLLASDLNARLGTGKGLFESMFKS
jgi:hypothetical protein